MNTTQDIVINGSYRDNGKGSYSKPYKSITVMEVTKTSVYFADNKGYRSWMAFDNFKNRMTLIS